MRLLHAGYFGGGIFSRMAEVLRYTAGRHCPGWMLDIREVEPSTIRRVGYSVDAAHIANTQKLEHWVRTVEGAPDGAEVLLMDADMFITRPLDDLWDRPFDVAYTVRSGSRFPFNGGVVALRVNDRTRALMRAWWDANTRLLSRPVEHMRYRRQYAGINQAAWGRMLAETDMCGCDVHALPCVEWNCEDAAWSQFDPSLTRIVHVKSALRRAVFPASAQAGTPRPAPYLKPLADLWHALEREVSPVEAA